MMKDYITIKWLLNREPCQEAVKQWKKRFGNKATTKETLDWLTKIHRYDWGCWLLIHLMDKYQCIKVAVFLAKIIIQNRDKLLLIQNYREKYLMQRAIENAKDCLQYDLHKTRSMPVSTARYTVTSMLRNVIWSIEFLAQEGFLEITPLNMKEFTMKYPSSNKEVSMFAVWDAVSEMENICFQFGKELLRTQNKEEEA